MVTVITIAFTMGLIGSLHCIGMCGPLALSIPVQHKRRSERLLSAFLYNAGRVTTYAVAGLLFGFAGKAVAFTGVQNGLSLWMGILILVYVLIPKHYAGNTAVSKHLNGFFLLLRTRLGHLFNSKASSTLYVIGLLNGLLPCGMVYLALVSAAATGTPLKGALFMAIFGAATVPALFTIMLAGNWMGQGLRLRLRRAVPALLVFMSALLILRGLHLGVPFLSPKAVKNTAVHCTTGTS